MVRLQLDPWQSDYGAGAESPLDAEPTRAVVDCEIETRDWSVPLRPPAPPRPEICFVDGVMRAELRVMASGPGGEQAWGMFGSCAAGAVRCDGRAASFVQGRPVRRVLVMGARVDAGPVTVRAGGHDLTYEPVQVGDDGPEGLRIALQRAMLDEEAALADELAGPETVVFADGPLHRPPPAGAVVGVVKRMVRTYLDPERAALLGRLGPGERTPLFALGNGSLDRYSWYLRLTGLRPGWHGFAALMRCEVAAAAGPTEARRLADLSAACLPSFAGIPGHDPRAPQNLLPVGALEFELRHRLGDLTLIQRALTAAVVEATAVV